MEMLQCNYVLYLYDTSEIYIFVRFYIRQIQYLSYFFQQENTYFDVRSYLSIFFHQGFLIS